MAEQSKIVATERTDFGKGAARRARRDKMIPAVVYGNEEQAVHILLPSHETFLALKDNLNALLEIEYQGEDKLALAKDVQLHPVRRDIIHVDLLRVRRGQKVTVDVQVVATGESAPGTVHWVELNALTITVPATKIPETIEVSIEGLEEGTILRVSDLELPAEVETDVDPETPVVSIAEPQVDAELEAADAEAAAEAAAEGEEDGGGAAAEGEGAPAEGSEDAKSEED